MNEHYFVKEKFLPLQSFSGKVKLIINTLKNKW
jgi:hypothetical protein